MDLLDMSSEDEWSLANRPGSRAARMLHMARRAERNLLSYERSGWLEVSAAKLHATVLAGHSSQRELPALPAFV